MRFLDLDNTAEMIVPVTEDGNVEFKKIEKLPLERRLKVVAKLTEEQFIQYMGSFPTKEGTQTPVKPVFVDYSMEEEIERGKAVEAFCFLKNLKENF